MFRAPGFPGIRLSANTVEVLTTACRPRYTTPQNLVPLSETAAAGSSVSAHDHMARRGEAGDTPVKSAAAQSYSTGHIRAAATAGSTT
ncbi:hypothetical protein BHQ19_22050 [Mycolicibacterium porcinum]|nr:hypothetical protein BHQ19_22050 [Mycolicibacterium porcinum]